MTKPVIEDCGWNGSRWKYQGGETEFQHALDLFYRENPPPWPMSAYHPTPVTQEQMEEIIGARRPLGRFYRTSDGSALGCDNSTGEAYVEEFGTEEECIEWLRDSPDEVMVVKGYGKMPKSIYDVPTPPDKEEWLAERVKELKARVVELETVIAAAVMMRTTQKLYFRTRSSEALDGSRRLEREFDLAAAAAMKKEAGEATLFG